MVEEQYTCLIIHIERDRESALLSFDLLNF